MNKELAEACEILHLKIERVQGEEGMFHFIPGSHDTVNEISRSEVPHKPCCCEARKAGLWVSRPTCEQTESTFQKDENAMEVSLPVQPGKGSQSL